MAWAVPSDSDDDEEDDVPDVEKEVAIEAEVGMLTVGMLDGFGIEGSGLGGSGMEGTEMGGIGMGSPGTEGPGIGVFPGSGAVELVVWGYGPEEVGFW
jgi:hypothetical protein